MLDVGAAAVPKKRKSSEKRKFNTLVRMDDELCEMARVIATWQKTSMAELFSDWLRPVVKREYEKGLARETKRVKGDEGSKT